MLSQKKNLVLNKVQAINFRRTVNSKHYTYGTYILVRVKKTIVLYQ